MLPQAQLRERGWTPAMIRDLLGDPDANRPNPYYASAAPLRLYVLDRVVNAERTPAFAERRKKAARRRAARSAYVDQSRQLLFAELDAWPIKVQRMPLKRLTERAVAEINAISAERSWDPQPPVTVADVDQATLDRWCVNYVRHQLTVYDEGLEALFGRIGRAQATVRWRTRIYAAIADAYPTLAPECARQRAIREEFL
jgi:hypothetical protein